MNINFTEASIASLSIHKVGRKAEEEGVILSNESLNLDEEIRNLLTHYFTSSFKLTEFSTLHHDSDINMNEIYTYSSNIFDDPSQLHPQSINIARHLYEQSLHPNIKGGELYVVYFQDAMVDGEYVDAVGLFKSENRDTFLKVYPTDGNFEVESEQGININKLDKGALIFNLDREQGYVVAMVDNTNKSQDARYWIDNFLHVVERKDDYYNTNGVMSLYKTFVTKEFPDKFDASKADQAELLNKSADFFKDKDSFSMDEFMGEVIAQPELIESFNTYKDQYQQERDVEFADSFSISDTAVKKQMRAYKSVIKLDKNFHIYVHGGSDKIEQGEDEKGRFYKVYYEQEM